MSGDVLSDVLQAVRLRGAMFYDVQAAEPWVAAAAASREVAAAVMPGSEHVMEFHVVTEGECWACLDGEAPEHLRRGDIVVFPRGDAHSLRSDPRLPAEPPVQPVHSPGQRPPYALRMGFGAPTTRFVCGFLGCDARPFNPLLEALPCLLRAPARDDADPIAEFARIAVAETGGSRPGSDALRTRLAEMMFIALLRRTIEALPAEATG